MTLTPELQAIRAAQLARIRGNPDGTAVLRDPTKAGVADLAVPAVVLQSGLSGWLDDYTAVQLGLAQLLQGLTFHVVDVKSMIERDVVERNTMTFGDRVFLDHPDPEDERIPTPSVTITEGSPPTLEPPGPLTGQGYLEGSEGQWGEGTILRVGYHASYNLNAVCWLAHKDERSAVRQGLMSAFYAEPRDEASDRRVLLPWYFNQMARYTLRSISYPDTDELAVRGTWPLVAEIQAEIVGLYLVPHPGYVQAPEIRISAE